MNSGDLKSPLFLSQAEKYSQFCERMKKLLHFCKMKTIAENKMEPFVPTYPGEVVKDEVEYRGISQRALAAQIGVSYTQLNEVLNGKRSMNTELALLIGAALGIDAEPLLVMQTRYDIIVAQRNSGFANRINAIRKLAAAF